MTACLIGSLEDFSLQDILQVIAMGRKTGWLSLVTSEGSGAVVFRRGRILVSVDSLLPAREPDVTFFPRRGRDAAARERIADSLERLAPSRKGQFSFQVSPQPPCVLCGQEIALEALHPGADVVDLLIEVACRRDAQERRAHSVLLVDDEELVRRILARHLAEGGYRVVEAGDVESAVERGASLGEAGVRFVLVADLSMPASVGDSFRGGFEVVKRLARLRLRPPVVMMADGASASEAAKPMRGVASVVHKPGLSKLDPEEFEADMRALAGRMIREVLPRVCGSA